MPEGLFLKLPSGPACERCAARTYVAAIDPHPSKAKHDRYTFECPRCYQLLRMTVAQRGSSADNLAQATRFVADAKLRIERQAALIRRLHHLNRDVTRAVALLEVLQDSLAALERYREHKIVKNADTES